jgi:hypothetical protein
VAFYDRRLPCPSDPSILSADVGRTNFCIDVSLQAYKDTGSGAVPVGGNVRITKFSWDPQQPGQTVGGLSQLPCADADCAVGFIGDYFGLAVSAGNIYALFVSTHYPSDVTADGGGQGGPAHRLTTSALCRRVSTRATRSCRTAAVCAFSVTVFVTQRHAVDRNPLEQPSIQHQLDRSAGGRWPAGQGPCRPASRDGTRTSCRDWRAECGRSGRAGVFGGPA